MSGEKTHPGSLVRFAEESTRKRQSLASSAALTYLTTNTVRAAGTVTIKLDGATLADVDEYSFEDNESELASLRRNGKISDIFTGGAAINQNQPGTVKVVIKKTAKPTVCM
jgi:hypothetical protein